MTHVDLIEETKALIKPESYLINNIILSLIEGNTAEAKEYAHKLELLINDYLLD